MDQEKEIQGTRGLRITERCDSAQVKRFPINERGLDYVIGDIHGAFDLVLNAMRKVRFDTAKDRLFAVGDLVDRGPGSHRCVKFLSQPYVHSVRGNHEDMILSLYAGGPPDPQLLQFATSRNGFSWWNKVGDADRKTILDAISTLPLAIEVETTRGLVGIIHGDVPAKMSWQSFTEHLERGDPEVISTCLTGRKRIKSSNQGGVPGIDRVFVGHTPQSAGLRSFGNLFAIDTGAVFGFLGDKYGHLTFANINAATAELTARGNPSSLLDVRQSTTVPHVPFGGSIQQFPAQ